MRHITLREALDHLPGPRGERFAPFEHGSLGIELYAPHVRDDQTPHSRDELYVVVRGAGQFQCGGRRIAFEPGDLLLVPAGVEHRFERFDDDFLVWAVFYGPEGGEHAA